MPKVPTGKVKLLVGLIATQKPSHGERNCAEEGGEVGWCVWVCVCGQHWESYPRIYVER